MPPASVPWNRAQALQSVTRPEPPRDLPSFAKLLHEINRTTCRAKYAHVTVKTCSIYYNSLPAKK